MEQIFVAIAQVLIAMGAAAVIAISIFASKLRGGEKFQLDKFVSTVLIGALLGLIACLTDFPLTAENYVAYSMTNVGIIGVANPLIKALWRYVKDRFIDNGGGGFPV